MNLREEILEETAGGIEILEYYLPQITQLRKRTDKFKIREEKTGSAAIKNMNGVWCVQDFGDANYNGKAKNPIDYVMYDNNCTYIQACRKIINDLSLEIDSYQHKQTEDYITPEIENFTELTDKQLKYLKERGLSTFVIQNAKLFSDKKYCREVEKEIEVIALPYIDTEGEIVNIKYRGFFKKENNPRKYYSNTKGAKRTFYGIHELKTSNKECVIVEGEIDKLSIDELNKQLNKDFFSISVPNGVNSLNQITDCWDSLEQIEMFYIFVDNDEAGVKLENELIRRLGDDKCKIVPKKGGKDANEILVKFGVEHLLECIESAKLTPITGEIKPDDLLKKTSNLFKYGIQKGAEVGTEEFKKLINFSPSRLTLVTGIPKHGKSNFVDQLAVWLAHFFGWNGSFWSPEFGGDEFHLQQLQEIYTGKLYPREDLGKDFTMDEVEFNYSHSFCSNHFTFVDIENPTPDNLFKAFSAIIKRNGCQFIVIDPFNRITKGKDEVKKWINDFLTTLNQFKKRHKIHIFLIAHPTKMRKNRKEEVVEDGEIKEIMLYDVPTPYDVSGSSDFFNQIDHCITVYRNQITDAVEVHIQAMKFKHNGKLGFADFTFHYSGGYRGINQA